MTYTKANIILGLTIALMLGFIGGWKTRAQKQSSTNAFHATQIAELWNTTH